MGFLCTNWKGYNLSWIHVYLIDWQFMMDHFHSMITVFLETIFCVVTFPSRSSTYLLSMQTQRRERERKGREKERKREKRERKGEKEREKEGWESRFRPVLLSQSFAGYECVFLIVEKVPILSLLLLLLLLLQLLHHFYNYYNYFTTTTNASAWVLALLLLLSYYIHYIIPRITNATTSVAIVATTSVAIVTTTSPFYITLLLLHKLCSLSSIRAKILAW